jgi:hypothetical protein
MNPYPSLTNIRSYLSDKFSTLQTRAVRDLLWAKLIGRNTKLELFPEEAPEKSPNRRFMGVNEIPVEQIIGTLGRRSDFDNRFRPIKSYLRDRWVNAYLALEGDGWSPILVHKVGENYYVEDGHHRVSVAQMLGLAFIQAKVWEYPSQAKETNKCHPAPCPERNSAKAYARVTE